MRMQQVVLRVKTPWPSQLMLPVLNVGENSACQPPQKFPDHDECAEIELHRGCQVQSLDVCDPWPDAFCWTRMHAESGQSLHNIIQRKEAERLAGGGIFYWGIGNSLGSKMTSLLARTEQPKILFSMMKSRPKPVDTSPEDVLLWALAVDLHGMVRPIPDHALVVSRGSNGPKEKLVHYALVCRSAEPLHLRSHGSFNLAQFRNIGSDNPRVGNSQVTAVLERQAAAASNLYKINMTADLVSPYFVRLAGPVSLLAAERVLLDSVHQHDPGGISAWGELVRRLRRAATGRRAEPKLLAFCRGDQPSASDPLPLRSNTAYGSWRRAK